MYGYCCMPRRLRVKKVYVLLYLYTLSPFSLSPLSASFFFCHCDIRVYVNCVKFWVECISFRSFFIFPLHYDILAYARDLCFHVKYFPLYFNSLLSVSDHCVLRSCICLTSLLNFEFFAQVWGLSIFGVFASVWHILHIFEFFAHVWGLGICLTYFAYCWVFAQVWGLCLFHIFA